MKTYTKDMEGIFMVDLKQKPYFLNDEQIKYIEDKIKEMSIEDKIGQLFFVVGRTVIRSIFQNSRKSIVRAASCTDRTRRRK